MENENLEVKSIVEKINKQKLTPFSNIFKSSIAIWWKNLRKFVEVYFYALLYSLIPLVIIFAGGLTLGILGPNINNWLELIIVILFVASFLVLVYFSIRAYAGMFLLVKKNYEGDVKETFKETKEIIWPYLVVAFLTGILVLLWTLLLIIPGIIFSIFYSFAVFCFFFEGKVGMAALKRSKELVKGYWWAVAGRFGFFALILWLFGFILALPLAFFQENRLLWQLWNFLGQIVNFLVGPIALLFSYQIYKDLVKIKS